MKQFKTIFMFEFANYLKNKIFVGVTAVLVIVLAAVMFFPRVMEALEGGSSPDTERTEEAQDQEISGEKEAPGKESAGELPVMLIFSGDGSGELIKEAFTAAFPEYDIRTADRLEDIKEQISSGGAECAFAFDSLVSYTYYVNNLSLYDNNTYTADEVLQTVYRKNEMISHGMSEEEASGILSIQIEHGTENLGKDQRENFFYTYIMIFALYFVIILYGQMVATNVAAEKSSRAMEVLITSAKPVSMMFGKVLASCLAGFLQLFCIFGSAFLFFALNKSYWGDNMIINSIFNMPLNLLVYMLLFFVLGFFIYAFLFGAVGSTVSKLEDINTAIMPLTIMFVIAFMVVMMSMTSGSVDNMLMVVCSYFPFTSPMAMFTRIAMSTVPWYQIAISVVLLIGAVFGVGVVSAKIYRAGVLLYGTAPKPGALLKSVWKAE